MVVYFVISIIHSMAQSYHKYLTTAKPRSPSASGSKTQVIKQSSNQSEWPIACFLAQQVLDTSKSTGLPLVLRFEAQIYPEIMQNQKKIKLFTQSK